MTPTKAQWLRLILIPLLGFTIGFAGAEVFKRHYYQPKPAVVMQTTAKAPVADVMIDNPVIDAGPAKKVLTTDERRAALVAIVLDAKQKLQKDKGFDMVSQIFWSTKQPAAGAIVVLTPKPEDGGHLNSIASFFFYNGDEWMMVPDIFVP